MKSKSTDMRKITLYHTSRCPSCHSQRKILQQLQQQNTDLDIDYINLEDSATIDLTPPVQSVPTLTIGPYRFDGLLSAGEITPWLGSENHDASYIAMLLKQGQLPSAQQWLQQHAEALPRLIDLLTDESIEMTVRIGLDALMEQLAETKQLAGLTHHLGNALANASESQCIDILHYLAMIGSTEAINYIKTCPLREHPEVLRVIMELLEELT